MAKTIEGVPDTISLEQLTEFTSKFGFEPKQLVNLNINHLGVTATVFEYNEDGSKKLNTGGNGYVKHVIRIPVEP